MKRALVFFAVTLLLGGALVGCMAFAGPPEPPLEVPAEGAKAKEGTKVEVVVTLGKDQVYGFGSNPPIRVQVRAAGGTATPGKDYKLLTHEIGWPDAGASQQGTSRPISFQLLEDTLIEGEETIDVALTVLEGHAQIKGKVYKTTVTIQESLAASVAFVSSATRGPGPHTIPVVLTASKGGTLARPATVDVALHWGAAGASKSPPLAVLQKVVFKAGAGDKARASVELPGPTSGGLQGRAVFRLALSRPSVVTLGAASDHVVEFSR